MANTTGAEKRITYLIGERGFHGSPNTISGNKDEVRSYRLTIAHREPFKGWYVLDDQHAYKPDGTVSRTTQRHIRAAYLVINSLKGYGPSTVERDALGRVWRRFPVISWADQEVSS